MVVLAVTAALLGTGVGAVTARSGSGAAVGAHGPGPHPTATLQFPTPIRHVFVVMMENANGSDVLQHGPFERYLAARYASADHYYGACHPSSPNYLAATAGWPFQCGSDNYTEFSSENLFDLAGKAGLSWADFSESMPAPCYTKDTFPPGLYVAHHNPAIYFPDIADSPALCDAHDVNFTAWNADVQAGAVPNYALFAPNMDDDGHQTGIAYGDHWLQGWLSPYLNDSWFQSSVFFITWDESAKTDFSGYTVPGFNISAGLVYLAVVSPYARTGAVLSGDATHYNLLTTSQWLLGLGNTTTGEPGDNANLFPPMQSLFSFGPGGNGTPPNGATGPWGSLPPWYWWVPLGVGIGAVLAVWIAYRRRP
jgi:hypothetical protein